MYIRRKFRQYMTAAKHYLPVIKHYLPIMLVFLSMLALSLIAGGVPSELYASCGDPSRLPSLYRVIFAVTFYYLSAGASISSAIFAIADAGQNTLFRECGVRAILFMSGGVSIMNFWYPTVFLYENYLFAEVISLLSASLSLMSCISASYYRKTALSAMISTATSGYLVYVSFAYELLL
ncbi:MAG: hypothetical protein LUE25_04945 [Clostridiales bacterium]|nr:hypothetical protein [Clostridiales bacterium]